MHQYPLLSPQPPALRKGLRRSLTGCLYTFLCFNTTHAISILPPPSIPYQNNEKTPQPLPAFYGMSPPPFNTTLLTYTNDELKEMYTTMMWTMSVASLLYLIKKITQYCLDPLPTLPQQ